MHPVKLWTKYRRLLFISITVVLLFPLCFFQIARRLQLRNLKEFRNCCGGEAIEKAALKGDPRAIDLGTYMTSYKDCNFSYSGLKNTVRTEILKLEAKHGKAHWFIEVDAQLTMGLKLGYF